MTATTQFSSEGSESSGVGAKVFSSAREASFARMRKNRAESRGALRDHDIVAGQ
jgi:hypothetical protein